MLSQVTKRFFTDYDALTRLDLDKAWKVEWWVLDTAEVPVVALEPHFVVLQQLKPGEPFWPVARKRGRRGGANAEGSSSDPDENSWAAAFRSSKAADESQDEEPSDSDDGQVDPEDDISVQAIEGEDAQEALARLELFVTDLDEEEAAGALVDFFEETTAPEAEEVPAEELAGPAGPEGVPEGPLPLPPAPQARAAPAMMLAGPRLPAEAVVTWPGLGKIAYHQSKASFEATCFCHPQCVVSRTANGRHIKGRGLVAGRPLGFLTCWVLHATSCDSKAVHWDKEGWKAHFTLESRQTARRQLLALPGGTTLAANERPVSPGEAEEPETLIGLL